MLVKMTSDEELGDLRQEFHNMDKDGTGMILASELSAYLQ